MEIFSETFKKLWNLWEIRSLVTLSLSLQIILIILGSRRKITNPHSWIGILLNVTIWCAYIAADWVATVALSVMAGSGPNCQYDSSMGSNRLYAFWAPFLLLHLGGPDNITAFSMEDNDLWLRHFLVLIVEVGVAFHVFMRFWSSNALTFLAIPVFIAGIVKYGERTWVLWSSSTRFGYSKGSFPVYFRLFPKMVGINPKDHNLVESYSLYRNLRYLVMDHPMAYAFQEEIYSVIREKSAEDAFKLVATEAGLMYDVLYTKTDIVNSRLGICLRCISFICSTSALVLFSIIIDVRSYLLIDIVVTYLLLVGAVVLETYAVIILLSSDWTKLRLINSRIGRDYQISRTLVNIFKRFTNCLHSCLITKKRWSESMGQYNLMSSVRKERQRTFLGLEKLPCTRKLLEKYQYLSWINVDINLQETIFNYLKRMANELTQTGRKTVEFQQLRDEYLSRRRENALTDYSFANFWASEDYDKRVIMWHIVTNECYEIELQALGCDANELSQDCKIGKWLSDYMVYLLHFCPSIFPKGMGQLRYEHTYKEIAGYPTDFCPYSVSQTAKILSSSFKDCERDRKRWEVITEVWLALLTYAASDFEWKEHTQYLRRGGELLTLISVLMIHLGLSKQMP